VTVLALHNNGHVLHNRHDEVFIADDKHPMPINTFGQRNCIKL